MITLRQKRLLLYLDLLGCCKITDLIRQDMREFNTFKITQTTKTFQDPREIQQYWSNLIKSYWRDLQKLKEYGLVEKVPHSRKYKLTDKGKNLVKQFHSHPLLLLKSRIEESDDG